MKKIEVERIAQSIERICGQIACVYDPDILTAICKGKEKETSPRSIAAMDTLVQNAQIAVEERIPICQDTGLAIVYLKIGQEVVLTGGSLYEAVNRGVRNGYLEIAKKNPQRIKVVDASQAIEEVQRDVIKIIETTGNSYDIKNINAKYHVDIPTESKWVDTGETTEVDGVVYHKLVDPSTLNVNLDESNKVVPSAYKDISAWAEYTNLHIDNYKIYQEIKKGTGSTFNWIKVDFTKDCDIYWQSSGEQNYDYLVCTSSKPTSYSYSSDVIFKGENKNITTDFSDTTWETYHVDHTATPTLYFWMKRDASGYDYQDSCLVALPDTIKTITYNEKYVDDNGNELVTNVDATV